MIYYYIMRRLTNVSSIIFGTKSELLLLALREVVTRTFLKLC